MNKWNSKRIAFVSILISMSISFVIIGAQAFALSSLPNIKLSLAGLPIKIVGYLFGPLAGLLVGLVTDLLSFVYVPFFYFPMYSLALGISGMLPGVSALFFNYVYKKTSKKSLLNKLSIKRTIYEHNLKMSILKNENKKIKKNTLKIDKTNDKFEKIENWKKEYHQINFALINGLIFIFVSLLILTIITWFSIPQKVLTDFIKNKKYLSFLRNKIYYLFFIWGGMVLSMFLLIIGRFKMKEKTFLNFVPITTFVLLTEYINLPIVAYADFKTIKVDFIVSYISSLLTSPIKIWMNLIIISFALKIVSPLIEKRTFNGYI